MLRIIFHIDVNSAFVSWSATKLVLEGKPDIRSEEDENKTYGELWPENVAKLREIIVQAIESAHEGTPDPVAIEAIGGGWTGHEALAIAIYSAIKHRDSFEAAVISAVNHSGDSDSTGAICGNIMGCLFGLSAIPSYFTEDLELLAGKEEGYEVATRELVDEVFGPCQSEYMGPEVGYVTSYSLFTIVEDDYWEIDKLLMKLVKQRKEFYFNNSENIALIYHFSPIMPIFTK